MYPRLLDIPEHRSFFLFGPRQTGKSTLLAAAFGDRALFYNLLKAQEYARLLANPSLLADEVRARASAVTHVVVDEIQRNPELLNTIHDLIESPNAPIFVMTGSSARKLKRGQANLLGGRAWTRYLFPLTHVELGSDFQLARALRRGTLPRIYSEESDEDAAESLASYVGTYMAEEIQAEMTSRSLPGFSRFLPHAIGGIGQLLNYSSIARETMTSDKTVKGYFQVLDDTLLGFHLLPYAKSTRKRMSRHPKFYLFDTGVALAIQGLERSVPTPGTPLYGDLFELWCVNEIKRLLTYWKINHELSFFRADDNAEVDILIETPTGKMLAVEIKSSPTVGLADVRRGFKELLEIAKHAEPCVIHSGERVRRTGDVTFFGWREFFEHLRTWSSKA